ncbi:MAG: glycerol-3-phosphate cytidylyltransferase [Omnitrophica bacterium RBG_13_46_9]|nr:MAG: glycerol-3-phosphate cytidylyltransferase [Omnitrophica bacterium RBG_13_46_9]
MGKIKTLAGITKIVAVSRKKNKKIIFTNGCFDLLHYGHIKYLQKCKGLGGILIVGINSDRSVKKIKGPLRPLTRERDRSAILAALECVDYVIFFNEATPEKVIKAIAPDILAKGGDWQKSDIVGRDFVEKRGGRVFCIPFVKGYSTTRIIEHIKKVF